jgi:hypothetical protein
VINTAGVGEKKFREVREEALVTHDGGKEGAERGEEVGDGDHGSGDGEEQHQRGAAGEPTHLGFLISDYAATAGSPLALLPVGRCSAVVIDGV